MPTLKISHVVSFSSEDRHFPADNLLVGDTYKKWKCKTAGEKLASVILQLDKATVISGVDIGNEHSAFVEVLVGRSGAPDEFTVLVVTSSFMSPLESKNGSPFNRVRMFGPDDLVKPTCQEKWDRVKLVCTQPFNKNVQFGLSFVTLHTREQKKEETPGGKVGRFAIKDEEEDDKEGIPVGSLFARRKELTEATVTGAAAIRDASKPNYVNKNSSTASPTLVDKVKTMVNKRSSEGSSSKKEKPPNNGMRAVASTSKESSKVVENKPNHTNNRKSPSSEKTAQTRPEAKKQPSKRPSPNNAALPPSKKAKPNVPSQRKPFGKLLQGVVFVLSGYQNPLRQNLRDKAIEMGARYKPDWNSDCTHLICAFPNTPKFQQVRGKGKIVSKQWLEDCYSDRKYLPWRMYALDRNDLGKDVSDEEIVEDVPESNKADDVSDDDTPISSQRRYDSGSDTEDEIERVKLISLREAEEQEKKKIVQPRKDKKKAVELMGDDGDDMDVDEIVIKDKKRAVELKGDDGEDMDVDEIIIKDKKKAVELKNNDGDDTDVDENVRPDTKNIPLPQLPDFYKDKTFYLHDDLDSEVKRELNRYIVAFEGKVLGDLENQHVDYLLANSGTDIEQVKTKHPKVEAVTPDWVWKCNDVEKRISTSPFKIQ